MSEVDPVRATIAAEHGLDDRAASFLTGDTVEAIEASAASLAKLLGERAEREATVSQASDPIARSLEAKSRKHDGLLRALHGQPAQARDERGRFAGFDGGVREPAPTPGPSHDEWLGGVLRDRRADVGANF